MNAKIKQTTVAIVGAGVSGLALAAFLRQSGVDCVVLERRERAYIETRQRAGVVDARGVRMFERWEMADKLLAGPVAQTIDYRLNGVGRVFEISSDDGSEGRFCTQQMLVGNLLRVLIDEMGGDVRFGLNDVTIENTGARPLVSYTGEGGRQVLECSYVIGCDGDRGISRASIPVGVVTSYHHEFGYAWLAALVETPLKGHPIMGISDDGCIAQLPRGPQRSRYYLQCPLSDGPQDWSDDRLWDEIRLRLRDESIPNSPVLDKFFVQLRSVVHSPMQHNNLFLAGDAAHLVPPASAKGMNLALYDIDILGEAILTAVRDGDRSALDGYSDTCLPHIWNYQDFATGMTDMMHDAGDPTQYGTFRQMTARARLDNLFRSTTAARLHSEYQQGTN